MKEELELFLKNNLIQEVPRFSKLKSSYECFSLNDKSIDDFIDNEKDNNNFQKLLFELIDSKNLKDSDVYNKVNIDRRLFSKIRNENYHPSKETIILLGISLNLSVDELEKLLESASYSLPKNNVYDLIIRFCFINNIYDLDTINGFLFDHKCKVF